VATTGRGCESARDSASPRGLSLPRRTLAGLLPCRAVPRSQTSSKTSPGLRPLVVLSPFHLAGFVVCVRVSCFGVCVPTAVPPPASEPTNTLLVRNFVRPFTLKAVKDLLAETGTVINFWMNDIKTHCYVSVRAPPLFDLFCLVSPSMANAPEVTFSSMRAPSRPPLRGMRSTG
jgi:hypothetical protein